MVREVELELTKQRMESDVEWTGPRVVSCPECGEAAPLFELRDSKLKVARAWAIKELLDDFLNFEFLADAMEFFKDLFHWATHCWLKPVIKVAKRLKNHPIGLEGYILYPISNAASEGFNSKIQNIKAFKYVASVNLIISNTPSSFTAANSISLQPSSTFRRNL